MKKGLVVGVAVGGLLYVMWRRRRAAAVPTEPQAPAWQPPPPPAPAEEPVAAEEPVVAEAPIVVEEVVVEEVVVEEVVVEEPVAGPAPAPKRESEPTLRHPGRRVPLTSSGFGSKPQVTAFHTSDRPQAAQARISWPGTGGPAAQRPKPLRLVPARSRPASLRRSR